MRKVLIVVGLVLLAALVPLAAPPVTIVVLDAPFMTAAAALFVSVSAPPVPLLAVTFLRGPPSR